MEISYCLKCNRKNIAPIIEDGKLYCNRCFSLIPKYTDKERQDKIIVLIKIAQEHGAYNELLNDYMNNQNIFNVVLFNKKSQRVTENILEYFESTFLFVLMKYYHNRICINEQDSMMRFMFYKTKEEFEEYLIYHFSELFTT